MLARSNSFAQKLKSVFDSKKKRTAEGKGAPTREASIKGRSATDAVPKNMFATLEAHEGKDVMDLKFTEGGLNLITSGNDGTLRVWDTMTGGALGTLRCGNTSTEGIDCWGGYILACNGDNTVKMWHIKTEKVHRNFVGHTDKVHACRFYPDGKEVLSGGADRTLRLWDVNKGVVLKTIRAGSTCFGIDIDHEGKKVATAHNDGVVRLWDFKRSSQPIHSLQSLFQAAATSVMYDREGTQILINSRDNQVKLVDTRTHAVIQTFSHPLYRTTGNWSRACFSPAGTLVVAGSVTGDIIVWDVQSGEEEAVLKGHEASVQSVWWGTGPQGPVLASGSKKGVVRMWH